MASTPRLPVLLLLGTFGAGIYCLHGLGFTPEGLMPRLEVILSKPDPLWPGTSDAVKKTFSGLAAVDTILYNLNPFFAHAVDGSDPSLSLWFLFFIGQYGAAFGLCWLESLRFGNKGRLISLYKIVYFRSFLDIPYFHVEQYLIMNSVTVWFTVAQLVGFAVAFPLYLSTHLLTSPLAKLPTAESKAPSRYNELSATSGALKVLPYALTLGYLLPSLVTLFPTTSSDTRQNILAVWQVFPLWTFIIYTIINLVLSKSSTSPSDGTRTLKTKLEDLNRVYRFLFVVAASTHLPALALTLFPTIIRPLFPKVTKFLLLHNVTFSSVFIPYAPIFSWRAKDLADGVHVFLWWDEYVGVTAASIWAVTLLCAARLSFVNALPGVVMATLLAGPFGGVVWMVWGRDVAVLRNDEGAKRK